MFKKIMIYIGLVSLLFLLAACGDSAKKEEQEFEVPTISEEEKLAEDELVATVNGDEIKGVTYNLVYAQLKLHAIQTGQEYSEEEIKDLTIESLIDRQILIQEAEEDGIVVTEEDAREELEKLKQEHGDNLATLLEQYQINEQSFQNQLVFELTMNEFLKESISVTVTNEEVEEIYEQLKEENEDMPELVEIHDTLKRNIENQKTNEALQERIESIKEQSKIELHL